jgi:hypothetical protein
MAVYTFMPVYADDPADHVEQDCIDNQDAMVSARQFLEKIVGRPLADVGFASVGVGQCAGGSAVIDLVGRWDWMPDWGWAWSSASPPSLAD